MLRDQAVVFVDFPTEPITISGTTYQCLVMDRADGNAYGEGGLVNELTLRVAIERGAINSSIPTQGTTATFASGSWRIGAVERDDDAASIVLTLENPTLR